MLICFLTAGERILHAFFHNTYSSSHMLKKTFNVICCTTLRVAHKWESVPIPTPSPRGPTLYPTHYHMPQHHSHPITICPNTLLIPLPYAPTPYPKHHHVPQHIVMCLNTIPTPSPSAPTLHLTHCYVPNHHPHPITMCPKIISNTSTCAATLSPTNHHVPQHYRQSHPHPMTMCLNTVPITSPCAPTPSLPLPHVAQSHFHLVFYCLNHISSPTAPNPYQYHALVPQLHHKLIP